MSIRWKRITMPANDGTAVDAWIQGETLIYLNANHGRTPPEPGKGMRSRNGDYWWFEVYSLNPRGTEGDLIGEAPTLARAKALKEGATQ